MSAVELKWWRHGESSHDLRNAIALCCRYHYVPRMTSLVDTALQRLRFGNQWESTIGFTLCLRSGASQIAGRAAINVTKPLLFRTHGT